MTPSSRSNNSSSARNLAMIIVGFVVVSAIIWSALWFYASGKIQQMSQTARQNFEAQHEISIVCDGERWSGFPYRHEMRCDRVVQMSGNTELASIENVVVLGMAWDPSHIIAQAEGRARWLGLNGEQFELSSPSMQASAKLDGQAVQRIDIELETPSLKVDAIGTAVGTIEAKSTQLHIKINEQSDNQIDVFAYADDLKVDGKPAVISAQAKAGQSAPAPLQIAGSENLIPPFALISVQLKDVLAAQDLSKILPLSRWQSQGAELKILDGVFAEAQQTYVVDGSVFFPKATPLEGALSVHVQDANRMTPFMAPLLFLSRPEASGRPSFENGVRYEFGIQNGFLSIGQTPILNLSRFLAMAG